MDEEKDRKFIDDQRLSREWYTKQHGYFVEKEFQFFGNAKSWPVCFL